MNVASFRVGGWQPRTNRLAPVSGSGAEAVRWPAEDIENVSFFRTKEAHKRKGYRRSVESRSASPVMRIIGMRLRCDSAATFILGDPLPTFIQEG